MEASFETVRLSCLRTHRASEEFRSQLVSRSRPIVVDSQDVAGKRCPGIGLGYPGPETLVDHSSPRHLVRNMDTHFDHRPWIDDALAVSSPSGDVLALGSSFAIDEVVVDGAFETE